MNNLATLVLVLVFAFDAWGQNAVNAVNASNAADPSNASSIKFTLPPGNTDSDLELQEPNQRQESRGNGLNGGGNGIPSPASASPRSREQLSENAERESELPARDFDGKVTSDEVDSQAASADKEATASRKTESLSKGNQVPSIGTEFYRLPEMRVKSRVRIGRNQTIVISFQEGEAVRSIALRKRQKGYTHFFNGDAVTLGMLNSNRFQTMVNLNIQSEKGRPVSITTTVPSR